MRALRVSSTMMVVLALLAGTHTAVAAQSEATDERTTAVSGELVRSVADTSEEEWTDEDGVGRARTYKVHDEVESSDPRLPADRYVVMNFDMYDIGRMREMVATGTELLVGEDGYWTGTFTGFCDKAGDCYGTDILTGRDAYDGLFAMLRSHQRPDDPDPVRRADVTLDGLIFEGEMPPMPNPIEAPTE